MPPALTYSASSYRALRRINWPMQYIMFGMFASSNIWHTLKHCIAEPTEVNHRARLTFLLQYFSSETQRHAPGTSIP